MNKIIITILIFILTPLVSYGQPAKYEMGSRENPIHTTPGDSITLRQYFDIRHKTLEDAVEYKIKGIQDAVDLARGGMEKRLDAMNEFRASLKDQATRFVTKEEYISQMKSIETDIKVLMTAKDQAEGKASQNQVYIAWGMGFLSLVVAITSLIMQSKKGG